MEPPELPSKSPRSSTIGDAAVENLPIAQISPIVLDCTPSIVDVRTLRAAAFAPQVLGVALLFVAAPATYVTGNSRVAEQFLAGSMISLLTALLIRRGVFIATLVFSMWLVAIVGGMLVVSASGTLGEEGFKGLLGAIAAGGIPCWLAIRAVPASWRLRRLTWRGQTAGILSAIAELPRDGRLTQALSPLAASFAVYGIGGLAGLIAGFATGHGLIGGFVLLPFAMVGSRLMQNAKRALALRVEEVRVRDSRPPLLLVRSFADDNLPLDPKFEFFGRLLHKRLTLEEYVVSHLLKLGPVVAIGKPHEGLSPLGAAREYIFGPGWQERVSTVLDECSWAVSILGDSQGLTWEYEQIIRRSMVDRMILVIPPSEAHLVRQRWGAFQIVFKPARSIDLPPQATQLVPLCVAFPKDAAPLLFCSKYKNETAYSVVLATLLARLT